MNYQQYYYDKTRYSSCSVNEYHHLYICFFINGKKMLVQKMFNKLVHTPDDVHAYIDKLIATHGQPLPSTRRPHKSVSYASNYRGVK